MGSSTTFEIIESAIGDPSVTGTDAYIEAQMKVAPEISSVVLQIGPACNLTCPHCYGDFGQHRTERPSVKMVKNLLQRNNYTEDVCLTDGEPFMYENKPVLKYLAKDSKKGRNLHAITNGVWGKTEKSALKWLKFMKKNGWDFSSKRHSLQVSCGITYDVPVSNYHNIAVAMNKTFGKNLGDRLSFSFLAYYEPEEMGLLEEICEAVGTGFSDGGEIESLYFDEDQTILRKINLKIDEALTIPINNDFCAPEGRARKIRYFDYPEKEIKFEDMPISVRLSPQATVAYNGDVGFGSSQRCMGPARVYGNVNDEMLIQILDRIRKDEIFTAKQLGQVRFLAYLAKEVDPGFKPFGRIDCNVCSAFFEDETLVEAVRQNLKKEGIRTAYRRYVKEIGVSDSAIDKLES